jgi:hypothetical protein
MAGLINLRLLTDFFNKIGHEQTFEKRRLHAKFRIRGDDQSGCVSVETSSDGPNAGRYRPNFNSKSLGTP